MCRIQTAVSALLGRTALHRAHSPPQPLRSFGIPGIARQIPREGAPVRSVHPISQQRHCLVYSQDAFRYETTKDDTLLMQRGTHQALRRRLHNLACFLCRHHFEPNTFPSTLLWCLTQSRRKFRSLAPSRHHECLVAGPPPCRAGCGSKSTPRILRPKQSRR
jgi:hypothetical protein